MVKEDIMCIFIFYSLVYFLKIGLLNIYIYF